MKMSEIHPGDQVTVLYGAALRPAIVQSLRADEKKVVVSFTDISALVAATIPPGNRGNLYGATVRPQMIRPARPSQLR